MPRYFIEFSYKGSAYHGWQIQPRQMSVQQKIQESMSLILKEKINLVGCGRTDTGVHAHQYYAHFDIAKPLSIDITHKLNTMLPNDIALKRHFEVDGQTHARFDAIDRTYKYFIHNKKNPFLTDSSFFIKQYKLDFHLMNEAAKLLIGEHDFSTFEKKGSDNETSDCIVFHAAWEKIDDERWVFTITANRFLRNMVRSITGSLLSVGTGRISIEELKKYFNNKTLIKNNIAVPAEGLFLWSIRYPFGGK
jgi:tRNA pseudouridine38-40 synthase